MKQLRESPSEALNPLSIQRQIGLLGSSKKVFSKDTLNALKELGVVLRGIQQRMRVEGYELTNGVIRKIETVK